MKVPHLARASIAFAANELLERGLGSALTAPVDLDALVFDYLCEHEGLVFSDDEVLSEPGSDEILGRTDLVAGRITICAALKTKDRRRYRFTVAHELGHWVLHRPIVLAGRAHPELLPREWVSTTTGVTLTGASYVTNSGGIASAEWQANYFAGHLLLPRPALRREFHLRHGEEVSCAPHGVSLREHSRFLARLRTESIDSLSDVFDASVEATAIAIEEAGLAVDQPLLL